VVVRKPVRTQGGLGEQKPAFRIVTRMASCTAHAGTWEKIRGKGEAGKKGGGGGCVVLGEGLALA
jgi:hypothetical protein